MAHFGTMPTPKYNAVMASTGDSLSIDRLKAEYLMLSGMAMRKTSCCLLVTGIIGLLMICYHGIRVSELLVMRLATLETFQGTEAAKSKNSRYPTLW